MPLISVSKRRRMFFLALAGLIAYLVIGNFLHLIVFAENAPDPNTYPVAGDVFGSDAEGFHQEILAVDSRAWVQSRLIIAPHAAGPPFHYHEHFEEHFIVESGNLSVQLESGVVTIGPGEELRVPVLTAHRPFNPTDVPVVIAGEGPVMPQTFAACLVQLYPVLDAGGPGILLQMSVIDPICDTHMADIPELGMVVMRVVLAPLARLLGYRSYDPAKSLHPDGTTSRG